MQLLRLEAYSRYNDAEKSPANVAEGLPRAESISNLNQDHIIVEENKSRTRPIPLFDHQIRPPPRSPCSQIPITQHHPFGKDAL